MKDQTPCLEAEIISRHMNLPSLKLSELQSQDGNPALPSWLLIQLLGRVFYFVTKIHYLRPSDVTFWRSTCERETAHPEQQGFLGMVGAN